MPLSAPVSSIQLTLNARSGRVTVRENDAVNVVMECRAWGRPTPTLVLVRPSTCHAFDPHSHTTRYVHLHTVNVSKECLLEFAGWTERERERQRQRQRERDIFFIFLEFYFSTLKNTKKQVGRRAERNRDRERKSEREREREREREFQC